MLIEKDCYKKGSARYKAVYDSLSACPLFAGIEDVDALISDKGFSLCSFASGEVIYDREFYELSLGVVIRGGALIYKGGESRKVLIGEKSRGGVFGAAALFGDCDKYASRIVAKGRETVVALIPQDLMRRTLEKNPVAAIKYIEFLSGKIRYLNSKLDMYTGTSPSDKLIAYLEMQGGETEVGMQKLSRELDIPRATLYRTVERLEANGAIARNDGKIYLK